MHELLDSVRAFEGVLELAPVEGSRAPEIAWGDHFFYYAPDGDVTNHEQPYATIVTKNYPDDVSGDLDRPERWRLNVHVGRAAFLELTGQEPRDATAPADVVPTDTVLPHPVHRAQGWVCVVNPGPRTQDVVVRLLRQAHEDAKRRAERRGKASG